MKCNFSLVSSCSRKLAAKLIKIVESGGVRGESLVNFKFFLQEIPLFVNAHKKNVALENRHKKITALLPDCKNAAFSYKL